MRRAGKSLQQWVRASLQLNTLLGVAMIGVVWVGIAVHLTAEGAAAVTVGILTAILLGALREHKLIKTTAEKKLARESLVQSQERYKLLERALNDGIWDRDLLTGKEYFSPRLKEIAGYADDEFPNDASSFDNLLHPDDKAAGTEALCALLQENKRYALDYRIRRKNGDYCWVHSRGVALRDAGNRPIRLLGAITDISARKRVEAAVKESRNNLERAEAMAHLGHYKFETGSTAFIWCANVYRMFGLSPETFTPTLDAVIDLMHPDDRPILQQYRHDVMAGLTTRPIEMRVVKDDGQILHIEGWSSPIHDSNGTVTGMFGTLQDVTERTQSQEALARANQELIEKQTAIDHAVIVAVTDVKGRIIYANDNFCRISGYTRAELLGATHRIVKSGLHPNKTFRDMYRRIATGGVWRGELCNKAKDGTLYWVDTTIVPQLGPTGKPVAYLSLRIDITARRRAEAELDRSWKFLHTIIEHVPIPIFVKDAKDWRYLLVNRAAEQFWGASRGEVIGKTPHDFFSKEEADAIAARDQELLHTNWPSFEERLVRTPRNGIRAVASKRLIVDSDDGNSKYLIGVIEDMTERKRSEDRIAYLARHDTVTGIANRTVLRENLEEAVARLRSGRESFAVFILDLDGFKYINDTLGHSAGDQLLKELALRLQSSLSATEMVARLGGDEFAIIQAAETDQRGRAIVLALKVLEIVARPFDLDGHKVIVGTSIGIALASEKDADSGELLKQADLALYRAKSEGRSNFCFFDDEMRKEAMARHRLLNDLRTALSRDEFELHYQILVDVITGRPCGAEALVRWRHPLEGLISPDRFIGLAEESGLIEPLGEWILERACTDAVSWPENIKVAVNLSAAQFRSGRLFDVVLCALVDSGLPPERLELEITESVLLQNKESYGVLIWQLKNIGISIVLDDFGTGYSSLNYLTRFPFDKIKIDKSFTQGVSNRADCAAVVASVLTLARGLDIAVTAEGVETKEQFELLRAAGVNQVQGYLFGRPHPVAELDFSTCEPERRAIEAA